jgi:hypothetical protein
MSDDKKEVYWFYPHSTNECIGYFIWKIPKPKKYKNYKTRRKEERAEQRFKFVPKVEGYSFGVRFADTYRGPIK